MPAKTVIRKNRHPLLRNRPQGVWFPDLVGLIRGYPKTQEDFDRRAAQLRRNAADARRKGTLTRRGVNNGWAGKKPEIAEIRRNSMTRAERLDHELRSRGLWEPDNWEAEICMREALAIALDRTYHARHRIAAVRLILTYTQTPRQARHSTPTSGLSWLESLLKEEKGQGESRS